MSTLTTSGTATIELKNNSNNLSGAIGFIIVVVCLFTCSFPHKFFKPIETYRVLFNLFLRFMCLYECLHVCMCTMCSWNPEEASGVPELEFETFMICCVVLGIRLRSSAGTASVLNLRAISPVLKHTQSFLWGNSSYLNVLWFKDYLDVRGFYLYALYFVCFCKPLFSVHFLIPGDSSCPEVPFYPFSYFTSALVCYLLIYPTNVFLGVFESMI